VQQAKTLFIRKSSGFPKVGAMAIGPRLGLDGGLHGWWSEVMATTGPDLIWGTNDADRLSGLAGNDTINGLGGNDAISGGDGDDWLNGGDGQDNLTGGAGSDRLDGGDFGDTLDGGLGDDTLDGGAAKLVQADTARYASATAGVTVRLDVTDAQDTGGAGIDTLLRIENLEGSAFNDYLSGDAGDNLISGGGGNDTLWGGSGGVDTLDGGSGVDATAAYDGVGWDNGTHHWVATSHDSPTNWVRDVLTDIEIVPVPLAGAIVLLVDSQANGGFSGAAEAMAYAADHYFISFAPDVADVSTTIAFDDMTVLTWGDATGTITMGAAVETLTLTGGSSQLKVVGNSLDNTIHAGLSASTFPGVRSSIEGGAGDDYLDNGGSGSGDTFAGGVGDDTIDGGSYLNTASYADATAGVRVSLAINGSQNTVGAGRDTLIGIRGLIGSGFADRLTGEQYADSLAGGAGNDTLDGGPLGYDTLDGGAGQDLVDGGYGNDVIVDSDGISGDTLKGGFDVDRLDYSGASLGAGAVIDLQAGLATRGHSSETITGFENLTGGKGGETIVGSFAANLIDGFSGSDTIMGGKGGDTLHGGANNDRLDGGLGDDSVDGGDGADTVVADAGADTLAGGDGVDLLDCSAATRAVTVDLSVSAAQDTRAFGVDVLSGFENLSTGAGADRITGDGAANLFITRGGDDRISAGDGADTVRAGAGDDRLDGGADNDLLVGGRGRDVLSGGGGGDVFDYDDIADAPAGRTVCDVIVDFSHAEGDVIDLADISPDTLSYVGGHRFHADGEGEVRVREIAGGQQWIQVDADGDGTSDLEIIVKSGGVVDQTDFVL
jgi:Ca2+-binding RTX toxin-like protein